MFDDLEKNNQNKNQSDAKIKSNNMDDQDHLFDKKITKESEKVDDIFSETNSSPKPSALQPKISDNDDVGDSINNEVGGNNFKKATILGSLVIILAIIIIGGYFMISKILTKSNIVDTQNMEQESAEQETNNQTNNQTKQETATKEQKNEQEIIESDDEKDTDQDGLTDAEEKRLGLSPDKADSDGDGLFDREEVKIYRTDPLNPDSDNDGYTDGDEVKNGYNPNGSGKLFELP